MKAEYVPDSGANGEPVYRPKSGRVKATWGRRWTATRRRIYVRDQGVCQICYRDIEAGTLWEIDHILPRVHGGGHEDSNLRLAHKLCNARRGDGRPRGLPAARVRTW